MRLGLGIGLDIANKVGGDAAVAPSNTVAPAISGTAVVGQSLTTTTGTWTGSPAPTYSYQWKRGATNIGTNSSTYTLVQADAGNTSNITCVVTATNVVGSANATSNTIAQILDANLNSFLTSAAITNSTIKSAENTFFIARKNITALSSAVASYHLVTDAVSNTDRLNQFKYNAYNPLDTNEAKRLSYNGTLTANTTGLQGSANGFANTTINSSTDFTTTDFTIVIVSRTTSAIGGVELGCVDAGANGLNLALKWSDNNTFNAAFGANINSGNVVNDTTAIFIYKRSGNTVTLKRNNVTVFSRTETGTTKVNNNIFILARNFNGSPQFYSSREYSFFEFINGALTTQQETDFYNILLARETALGRPIGPPIVSDADAQAFVNAAELTSQTQANAINTLVIGMKAQSLWTKMEAIYPFVGGTAFSHKFNLKNPADADAAFRLAFNGTWTHTSSGAKPNGTNGYARTYCVPSSTARSAYGVYTTEQLDSGVKVVMAQSAAAGGYMSPSLGVLGVRGSGTLTGYPNTTKGMILGYDIDTSTSYYANINGTGQTVTRTFAAFNANDYYLGAYTAASYFSANNLAFAFVGGLANQTEATALRTLVQAYQTSLGRQV